MTDLSFNNEAITWNRLEGIDHLQYFILDVDSERQIVDVLFKFDANEQIVLHRHVALNHMLVLQGEHRLYEPDGSVKEVRHCGSQSGPRASWTPPWDLPSMRGALVRQSGPKTCPRRNRFLRCWGG